MRGAVYRQGCDGGMLLVLGLGLASAPVLEPELVLVLELEPEPEPVLEPEHAPEPGVSTTVLTSPYERSPGTGDTLAAQPWRQPLQPSCASRRLLPSVSKSTRHAAVSWLAKLVVRIMGIGRETRPLLR